MSVIEKQMPNFVGHFPGFSTSFRVEPVENWGQPLLSCVTGESVVFGLATSCISTKMCLQRWNVPCADRILRTTGRPSTKGSPTSTSSSSRSSGETIIIDNRFDGCFIILLFNLWGGALSRWRSRTGRVWWKMTELSTDGGRGKLSPDTR